MSFLRFWYTPAHLSRNMTKPTKWHVRPAKTACASAQSDKNLRCQHEESLGLLLLIERAVKTDPTDLSLRWAHSHCVGLVMRRLIYQLILLTEPSLRHSDRCHYSS